MIDFPRGVGRAAVSLSHRGYPLGVDRSPVAGLAADSVAWSVRRGLVAILPLVVMASGCAHSLSATQGMHAPSVARVERGPVSSMVTATGTLHAMTTQSLGFPQGGRVTEITVSVGDHVTAGQVLARVDDSRQKIVVRNSQDEVTRQQALLDQVTAENTPGRASAELELSERLLVETQKAADDSYRADTVAIGQFERQLQFDEGSLKQQEKELSVDRKNCPNYPNPPQSSGVTVTTTVTTGSGSSSSPPPGDVGPCEFLESRFDSISAVRRQIIGDQEDIENSRAKRDSDQAQEEANIGVQRVNVILAQDKKGLAGTDTHYSLLEQQQNLDEAKNNLTLAQQELAATVVKSSFTGTVARINGRVGEVLTASYHTALPVPAGDRSSAGGRVPTHSSGADALIVLDHVNSFQMTVPFTKADVGRMTPNQAVDVSFPAIPGLTRQATVTDIAPAPVTSTTSDDQNYLVTLALTELDPRLQDGMTAQAHIVTGVVTNALVVPSAAVRGIGHTGTVSMVGLGGARREVSVQIGAVGEHDAQVVSGLREGDQVVVP
ncbi:MAG TPA: biotin/lipoyl-binding protein [Pseudonocardiaceae bacterium]|nr:biotin/lipoyl-binding protein [Pseudonocardiaceae bacterium]